MYFLWWDTPGAPGPTPQVSVPVVAKVVEVSVPKDDSDSSEKAAKKKTSDSGAAGRSVQRFHGDRGIVLSHI